MAGGDIYRHEEGGCFGYNNLIKWSTPSSGECGGKKILKLINKV